MSACYLPSVAFSARRTFHRPVPAQPSVAASQLLSLRFSLKVTKTQRGRIPTPQGVAATVKKSNKNLNQSLRKAALPYTILLPHSSPLSHTHLSNLVLSPAPWRYPRFILVSERGGRYKGFLTARVLLSQPPLPTSPLAQPRSPASLCQDALLPALIPSIPSRADAARWSIPRWRSRSQATAASAFSGPRGVLQPRDPAPGVDVGVEAGSAALHFDYLG